MNDQFLQKTFSIRKKIGVDLDDVVFEFVKVFLKHSNKEFKKKVLFEDVFSYNFSEVFDVSLQEILKLIEKIFTKEMAENMELCNFSKEAILKLSQGNDIYFITSRVFREGTLESLKKHFSNFELVFSSNPFVKTKGKTKGEICKELGIDFMIEDCKEHSLLCAEKGIKTFLLNKPWNKDFFPHKNIIKVKNWGEILRRLEKIGYGN